MPMRLERWMRSNEVASTALTPSSSVPLRLSRGQLDQPVDPQSVVGKVGLEQRRVLPRVEVLPVVPEIGGDVFLGVLTGLGVHVLEQPLDRADQGVADALRLARRR